MMPSAAWPRAAKLGASSTAPAAGDGPAKGCGSGDFSGKPGAPVVDLGLGLWASGVVVLTETMGHGEMVKQVIDRKGPLKGKGGDLAQWHREATEKLAAVHQAMESLAQSVREVQGRRWNLNVYRLRTRAHQLRWRETGTGRRHSLWQRIEPELALLAPGLAQWYREVEDMAQILNHKEQVARYELKTITRLLEGRPRIAKGQNWDV